MKKRSPYKNAKVRQYHLTIGIITTGIGTAAAQRVLGISRGAAQYWRRRLNRTWHNKKWGGEGRHVVWAGAHAQFLEAALWRLVKEKRGQTSLNEITRFLRRIDPHVNRSWVQKLFASWGWSWKYAGLQQLAKFTTDNITYTYDYLRWTLTIQWDRLVFAGMSSFHSSF